MLQETVVIHMCVLQHIYFLAIFISLDSEELIIKAWINTDFKEF